MADNHIIIGLGGTGGRIIRSYREQLVDKFGSLETVDFLKNIRFLFIDSNEDDLKDEWMYQGKPLKLRGDDTILLKAGDLNSRLKNHATRNEWLGEDSDWKGIKDENTSGMAGNQLRRLGRVNLIPNMREIVQNVNSKHDQLRVNKTEFGTTIHICVGLAGGTGSGSIIDVTAQLCKTFEKESENTFIVLYLVLPEVKSFNDKKGQFNNVSFLKINGYAALKELNSLASGVFSPYDVNSKNDRLNTNNRYKSAYIISERNLNRMTFKDTASSVASLLFLKTISANYAEKGEKSDNTLPNLLNKVDTQENNLNSAWQYWDLSANFRVPGISKIAVPREQIKEAFAHQLVLNAFNKTLFKNKEKQDNGNGYLGNPSSDEIAKAKSEAAQIISNLRSTLMEEWYLTYEYFLLDSPMIDSEKVGLLRKNGDEKSFDASWKIEETKIFTVLTATKKYQGTTFEDRDLLKYYQISIADYTTGKYKGCGYDKFYNDKFNLATEYAKFICERIRGIMFGIDGYGRKTHYPLPSYIDILLEIEQGYLDGIDRFIKNQKSVLERDLKKITIEIENIKKEYVGTYSFLGSKNKRTNAVEDFRKKLMEYWNKTVELKAIPFAIELSQKELKTELSKLRERVKSEVRAIEERRNKIHDEWIDESKKIEGTTDGFKSIPNIQGFEKFKKAFFKSDECESFISQLENLIYDNFDFTLKSSLDGVFSNRKHPIMEAAYKMVDDILTDDNIGKLTGDIDDFYRANIIQVLHKKYKTANNPDLIELFAELQKMSAPLATINSFSKGDGDYKTHHDKVIILPELKGENESKIEELKSFSEDLQRTIRETIKEVKIYKVGGDKLSNELTFVQFAWPIRMDAIDNISDLYEDYHKYKGYPQTLFLSHIEDCDYLVDLIPPQTIDEMKKVLLPYMIILSESKCFENYGDKNFWGLRSYNGDDSDLTDIHAIDSNKMVNLKFECGSLIDFMNLDLKTLDKANLLAGGGINTFIHPLVLGCVRKEAEKKLNSDFDLVLSKFALFLDDYLATIKNDRTDGKYQMLSEAYRKLIKLNK
ncbi:hypothetical protein GCM10022389_19970 [Flavobacterium cheonanense]|uniref:Tubulin like n=1 Tax=Flavobacterium cheonanense TaxID=706183 RepID=A0ABP7VU02_9FLAO